jgi:hypothetical protein
VLNYTKKDAITRLQFLNNRFGHQMRFKIKPFAGKGYIGIKAISRCGELENPCLRPHF